MGANTLAPAYKQSGRGILDLIDNLRRVTLYVVTVAATAAQVGYGIRIFRETKS